MALHYKFSDANVSLVYIHPDIYTLHIRKYNNYKCKATTLVMMQVLLLIMKACNCI